MAGQCRIDERGRRIKIAMDRYEVNLRHVLDMESSNLTLRHTTQMRMEQISMTLNPTIFECERIETDR